VKYLVMIYSNPQSRQIWDSFTDAQREAGWRTHHALLDDLTESGELILAEGLADPSLSRGVSVRDGHPVTSDGPFAEAKELLAGIYLVECETIERAVEIAASMPEAPIGEIEVRPVMDLGGLEM
jgi:hypothetical protein